MNASIRCITLGLLSLAVMGCGSNKAPRAPADSAADGHERMLRELLQLKNKSHATPRQTTGIGGAAMAALTSGQSVKRTRARLEALKGDLDDERFEVLWELALHELRDGLAEESIEHLQAAYKLLPKVDSILSSDRKERLILDLAVAWLRLGETENCVQCQSCESCILPIRGTGVHTKKRGSEMAVLNLKELLNRNPDHLTARWLLNIAWMTLGQYPDKVDSEHLIPPDRFTSAVAFPRFQNVAVERGVNTFSNAGGVVTDDFDNDGDLDLLASDWSLDGQLRVFQNRGDGTFIERTKEANLLGLFGGLNLVQADFNNDGAVDVLVLRGAWLGEEGHHPKSLLQNDGSGNFRDVTFESGLGDARYPTPSASWADYDNDGDLDLYFGNEEGACQLFQNDGLGYFKDVTEAAGVTNQHFTKGVVWGDYDDDRLSDLYVSNMGAKNRLYRNLGDGTFRDEAERLQVTNPHEGFSCWFWDYNNDGALDIYAASYDLGMELVAADYLGLPFRGEPDCLYEGDGKGRFREVSGERGLVRATQPMGANFGDLDNDGFPDFYLGTGYFDFHALMPNLMFHNVAGQRFDDVTFAGGFGHLQKGHGVAFADLDADGDQDVFIETGGAFKGDAFENVLFDNPGFGNHWLGVKLIGTRSNRSAIGARIRVEIEEAGATRSVYKWVNSGGSFGASALRQHIGIGQAERVRVLEVFWPTTGERQSVRDIPADQIIELTEGTKGFRTIVLKRPHKGQPGDATTASRQSPIPLEADGVAGVERSEPPVETE